jgi:hypothetical protein
MVFKNPGKRVILLLAFLALVSGLHAQTEFPGKDYWSLDAGFGMTGFHVKGQTYQFILDPKLWLSPALMVGSKLGAGYSSDEILSFEGQVYLRWNFLRLGEPERTVNTFVQGGLGILAMYRGTDSPFSDVTMNRGSLLFDAAAGVTIPLTSRWHIEPSIRAGYPHIAGFSITAGYKFPAKTKKETIAGSIKALTSVDYIMFGPDEDRYNVGIDRDAQGLNELVLNNTAQMLKDHSDYQVIIEGHANPVTNAPGEADRLMTLGKKRANVVAERLKAKGVDEKQMDILSLGGTKTITSDYNNRNRNRRVELTIIQDNT